MPVLKEKEIYIHKTIWTLYLKNGKNIVYKSDNSYGEYIYLYDYKPNDSIEEFKDEKTVFKELLRNLNYIEEFQGYITKFSKRIYIDDYHTFKSRIYKDEVDYFTIQHIYKTIDSPNIKKLMKDLDFYKYSELVFNREQQLRKMLINIK